MVMQLWRQAKKKHLSKHLWPGVVFAQIGHIEPGLRSSVCVIGLCSERISFLFLLAAQPEALIISGSSKADHGHIAVSFPMVLFGRGLKCLYVCCSYTEVRGFACVSEWFGKSGPVLDTEIINPFGVGSSFTLSMILRAAYQRGWRGKEIKGGRENHQGWECLNADPPSPFFLQTRSLSCSRDHERPFIHDSKRR